MNRTRAVVPGLVVATALLFGACSGDESGESPPVFKVVGVVPEAGASGVANGTAISATFDTDLDASSLVENFSVSGVSGKTSWSAPSRTATFTPDAPLPANQTFTATLGAELKSASGDRLGTPFTWTFDTMDTTPPTVVSTNPAEGATEIGRSKVLELAFSEAMDEASLTEATVLVSDEETNGPVSGRRQWNAASKSVVFLPDGQFELARTYRMTVTTGATDLAGNGLAAEFSFSFTTTTVDTEPPRIVSVSPQPGSAGVDAGSTITATFSEAIQTGSLASSFVLSPNPGGTVTWDAASRKATLTPTRLGPGTTYTARISNVRDLSGNAIAEAYSWSFTVAKDTTPPSVVSTTPANGATGIPGTDRTVTVTFSEPIQTSFTVTAQRGTNPVAITRTWNAATRTLTGTLADNPLTPGATYTVTLDGVRDQSDNTMATYSLSFRVEPDSVPPTVTTITPANGARLVGTNAKVTVVFSEEVEPATVTSSNLSIAGVTSTLSYSAAHRTATLTPSSPLQPGTRYTVNVGAGIRDLSDNPLTAVTAKFRTLPVPQRVSVDTAAAHVEPFVSFTPTGDGISAWKVAPGESTAPGRVAYALYSAASSTWSAPVLLAEGTEVRSVAAATGRFAIAFTPSSSATVRNNVAIIENGNATLHSIASGGQVSVAATRGTIVAWAGGEAVVFSNGAWGSTYTLPGWVEKVSASDSGVALATLAYRSNGFSAWYSGANVVWNGTSWSSSGYLFNAEQASRVTSSLAAGANGFVFGWHWTSSSSSFYGSYQSLLTWSAGTFSTQTSLAYQAGGPALVGSDGTSYMATWAECPNVPNCTPQLRWRRWSGGAWSAPAILASSTNTITPLGVVGTPTGYLVTAQDGANVSSYEYSTGAGTWSSPVPLLTLAPDTELRPFQLVANGATVATLYGVGEVGTSSASELLVRQFSSGTWSGATTVQAGTDRGGGWAVSANGSAGGLALVQSVDGEVAARTIATAISAPTTLSTGITFFGDATSAKLALADDGSAYAAWLQYDRGEQVAYGALYTNKTWGTPVRLSEDADQLDVATDGSAFLVVIGGKQAVYARVIRGGTVSPLATLDSGAELVEEARGAAGGGFVAAWAKRASGSSTSTIAAATSSDGATWTAPAAVGTASGSPRLELAAASGSYAIAYGSAPDLHVYSGGSWSAKSTLATSAYAYRLMSDGASFQVLANYDGRTVVPLYWTYAGGNWTSNEFGVTGGGSGGGGMLAARNGTGIVAYVPHYVNNYGTRRDAFAWNGTSFTLSPTSVPIDSTEAFACDGTSCLAVRNSSSFAAGSILDGATPMTDLPLPQSTSYGYGLSMAGGGGNLALTCEVRAANEPMRIWALTEM